MKNRCTEEQIIGVLKQAEAGMKVAEVCRKYGIWTAPALVDIPDL